MSDFTLYHGDAIEVLKGIDDNSIDFISADPPYGILKHRIETVIDIAEYFRQCYRVLKKDCFNMYFGRQPTLTTWSSEAFKLFAYKQEIIWYKRRRSSPLDDIGRTFENIMLVMKGFRKINPVRLPYNDVKENLAEFCDRGTIFTQLNAMSIPFRNRIDYENALNFVHTNDESAFYYRQKIVTNAKSSISTTLMDCPRNLQKIKMQVNGVLPQNLISFTPHNRQNYDSSGNGGGDHNLKHPTVKPVNMLEYLILLCTNEGDTVLDPFMGTGTTGIACANTGRNFIGVELDPEYFALSQERITKANLGREGEIIAPDPLPVKAKVKLQMEMF